MSVDITTFPTLSSLPSPIPTLHPQRKDNSFQPGSYCWLWKWRIWLFQNYYQTPYTTPDLSHNLLRSLICQPPLCYPFQWGKTVFQISFSINRSLWVKEYLREAMPESCFLKLWYLSLHLNQQEMCLKDA